MKKRLKQYVLIFSALVAVIILSTVLIGNYFVDYALIPGSGGEDRQVEQAFEGNQEKEKEIKQYADQEARSRDQWIEEVKAQTKHVTVQSKDGLKLSGHTYTQANTHAPWIIIVHGYQSSEAESQILARHFYQMGYNILTPTQRAHKGSEGRYIGMGYLEKDDLLAWTKWLIKEVPGCDIIYHGTSMGGATVLMAAGSDLPKNVKAVIEDCGYTSIQAIFASELNLRFHLPSFPVLDMARVMGYIRAKYDFHEGDTLAFTKQSKVPIMFIHTQTDDFVPVSMAKELYDAKKVGHKELYITEDGLHAEAKYTPLYYDKIQAFIVTSLEE